MAEATGKPGSVRSDHVEQAQPLLDAMAHIKENVEPITEEFHALGQGRKTAELGTWSMELLDTAKQGQRCRTVELLPARRGYRRRHQPGLCLRRAGTKFTGLGNAELFST